MSMLGRTKAQPLVMRNPLVNKVIDNKIGEL